MGYWGLYSFVKKLRGNNIVFCRARCGQISRRRRCKQISSGDAINWMWSRRDRVLELMLYYWVLLPFAVSAGGGGSRSPRLHGLPAESCRLKNPAWRGGPESTTQIQGTGFEWRFSTTWPTRKAPHKIQGTGSVWRILQLNSFAVERGWWQPISGTTRSPIRDV